VHVSIKHNLSLKADHPPSGFFGFVLGFVAAGVGLAQALAKNGIVKMADYCKALRFRGCLGVRGNLSAWMATALNHCGFKVTRSLMRMSLSAVAVTALNHRGFKVTRALMRMSLSAVAVTALNHRAFKVTWALMRGSSSAVAVTAFRFYRCKTA
jgi:hypothetical protein